MKRYVFILLLMMVSIFTLSACKNNDKRELSIEDGDVALLSIFADNGESESNLLLRNYGHAFLSIKNISANTFTVGDREVLSGETITVGLWNVLEHFGVWYNIESNYISEYGKYMHRVSLTIGIDLEDIVKLNDVIDSSDRWDPLFNCSTFALKMWNSVANDNEKINSKFIVSPSYLVSQICKFEEYEENRECSTDKNIKYYKEG